MNPSSPVPDNPPHRATSQDVADAELRDRLDLRPVLYPADGRHPDARPCPSWCWVERSGGDHQHELMASHPMKALHHIDEPVRLVASMYPGDRIPGVAGRVIRTATVEADLTQQGSADPVISLTLHRGDRPAEPQSLLTLTLPDARELTAALGYLLDLAGLGR